MKPQDLKESVVAAMSKKLATLEMKELNERQKAEHAAFMYEQQKSQLRVIEDRNFELEQKFNQVILPHRATLFFIYTNYMFSGSTLYKCNL